MSCYLSLCFVLFLFTARGFRIFILLWRPVCFGTTAAIDCIWTLSRRGNDVACLVGRSAATGFRPRLVLLICDIRPTKAARRSKAAVTWFKPGPREYLATQVLLPFGSGADQPQALVGENARQRPRPELKKASRTSQCANAKEETNLGRCCILKRQAACPRTWEHLEWRAAARQCEGHSCSGGLVGLGGFSAGVSRRGAAEGQHRRA